MMIFICFCMCGCMCVLESDLGVILVVLEADFGAILRFKIAWEGILGGLGQLLGGLGGVREGSGGVLGGSGVPGSLWNSICGGFWRFWGPFLEVIFDDFRIFWEVFFECRFGYRFGADLKAISERFWVDFGTFFDNLLMLFI